MKGTRLKGDVAALNVVAMVLIAYIAQLAAEEAFGRHDRIHRGAVDRRAGLMAGRSPRRRGGLTSAARRFVS